jgi:hypothetical protein
LEEIACQNRWQSILNDIVQILIIESFSLQKLPTQLIHLIAEMLNASSSFSFAIISFSFVFPYLKIPNTPAAKVVYSLFSQLSKKDDRLEAILHKISSTTSETTPASASSSLQEKQAKLEALRQRLCSNSQASLSSAVPTEWTLCSDWDHSIPLGYPPTHTENLFTYLQQ